MSSEVGLHCSGAVSRPGLVAVDSSGSDALAQASRSVEAVSIAVSTVD